jgi:hypothetical protein
MHQRPQDRKSESPEFRGFAVLRFARVGVSCQADLFLEAGDAGSEGINGRVLGCVAAHQHVNAAPQVAYISLAGGYSVATITSLARITA